MSSNGDVVGKGIVIISKPSGAAVKGIANDLHIIGCIYGDRYRISGIGVSAFGDGMDHWRSAVDDDTAGIRYAAVASSIRCLDV